MNARKLLTGIAITVAVALLVGVVLAGVVAWTGYRFVADRVPELTGQPQTRAFAEQVVVMPTSGGQLEVATVKATEVFERKDPKFLDPKLFDKIDLGTTVSRIRVDAAYRFHIKLEKAWKLEIRDKTCIVRAAAVEPTLPVAFDTATLEKDSRSGWARFNKAENLEALERSLTQQLAERAPRYQATAAAAGRAVVARFVTDWLLKEQQWGSGPDYQVIVLYPGEQAPSTPTVMDKTAN